MHKYSLILLLIVLIGCSEKPKEKQATPRLSKEQVEELEKKGFAAFQNTPVEAVSIFKRVALEYERLQNGKKAGTTNLNIANIYEERLNQLDSALVYSQKSLQIWKANTDTLQMANLYKYIGLLKGKLGLFQEAKASINEAIKLYKAANFEQGIAVSEINLADVYLRAGNFKESESLFLRVKEFWTSKEDKGRVYANNLLGMEIYEKMGSENKIKELIAENRDIEKGQKVNPFIKKKFEELIKKLEASQNISGLYKKQIIKTSKAFDHISYIKNNSKIRELDGEELKPRYFIDYIIENQIEKPEYSKYITDRNLLRKLKVEICTENHILIKDTLLNGNLCEIEVYAGEFIEAEHQVKFRNNSKDYKDYETVDGKLPYGGFYGKINRDLKSLSIKINNNPINTDINSYSNIYEPNFCSSKSFYKGIQAYEDDDNIYIYVTGGNAADTYFGKIVFNQRGFITSILIDYVPLSMYGSFHSGFIGF